jgi:hypothetical protein
MKNTFLIILFLIGAGSSVFCQDRISVEGNIQVPVGEESGGMIIYNLTSEAATVSNAEGGFSIPVKLNDSIRLEPAGFQNFIVIIDQGVIDSGELNIFLNEVVNLLPEVVVSPYDLSGNVRVDAARLSVAELPKDLASSEVQNIYFESDSQPDFQSPPRNVALAANETRLVNGINFVNIFKELLIENKKSDIKDPYNNRLNNRVEEKLRIMYDDSFFRENLNIDMQNVNDFIYFADENGLKEEMLKEGNELKLIEFLVEQSKRFKKKRS